MGARSVPTVGSADHDLLLRILRNARETAGVSQRELSRRLDKPFTYMAKVEQGTRRLDVIELIHICQALDLDVVEIVKKLLTSGTFSDPR